MTRYVIHTAATAATTARGPLTAVEDTIGFLPNVFAVLGNAPSVLDALVAMNTHLARGRLSPIDREIVQLAVSVQNGCGYCAAGHTAFATGHGMPAAEIAALRANRPLTAHRQEALRRFAETLADGKGHGADAEYEAFLEAGYSAEQALDVALGVAVKTFTNAVATLLKLPADENVKPYVWSPEEVNRAATTA